MAYVIEHVGLKAKDPERLAEWYQKVFGFEIVSRNDRNPPTIFVGGPEGCLMEIMPKPADSELLSPLQKQEAHLAIKVDDFPKAIADLRAHAIDVGDVEYRPGVLNMVFFGDPEDNWLQVVYRPTPLR